MLDSGASAVISTPQTAVSRPSRAIGRVRCASGAVASWWMLNDARRSRRSPSFRRRALMQRPKEAPGKARRAGAAEPPIGKAARERLERRLTLPRITRRRSSANLHSPGSGGSQGTRSSRLALSLGGSSIRARQPAEPVGLARSPSALCRLGTGAPTGLAPLLGRPRRSAPDTLDAALAGHGGKGFRRHFLERSGAGVEPTNRGATTACRF